MKTCCFTGHRDLTDEQTRLATIALVGCIEHLINKGYSHFISGFANGADLLAAGIVCKFKHTNKNIFLEAAIPYRNRLNSKNIKLQNVLSSCNKITVIQEKYDISCFMKRNKYMVDHSDIVIAIWNGIKKGGTYNTIAYAQGQGKNVIPIHI